MRAVQERFEEKFVKGGGDDCWNWVGSKSRNGYGQIRVDGKIQYAHRVAYWLYIGEIPNRLRVFHRCDNPACVRPDHLFLGTLIEGGKMNQQLYPNLYPGVSTYIQKPEVVRAIQLKDTHDSIRECLDFVFSVGVNGGKSYGLAWGIRIEYAGGTLFPNFGDYIVKSTLGNFFVFSEADFEDEYTKVVVGDPPYTIQVEGEKE